MKTIRNILITMVLVQLGWFLWTIARVLHVPEAMEGTARSSGVLLGVEDNGWTHVAIAADAGTYITLITSIIMMVFAYASRSR